MSFLYKLSNILTNFSASKNYMYSDSTCWRSLSELRMTRSRAGDSISHSGLRWKSHRIKVHRLDFYRFLNPFRWCTLSCEYLRAFSKKIETALIGYSGPWGNLIREKNMKSKFRGTVPLIWLSWPSVQIVRNEHSAGGLS